MTIAFYRQKSVVRITAFLLILGLSLPIIGSLSQEAEACLIADIICGAARGAAKAVCDDPDVARWICILAEHGAEAACDLAQEYLCGSSSS